MGQRASRGGNFMRISTIYGNPKRGGFVHGCLDLLSNRLEEAGAVVERHHLRDLDIKDCQGCFRCFQSGLCVLKDDMQQLYEALRAADGLILGCSVRNETITALYKRFYERITYPLGFGQDLKGKYVLSVTAVGMAGGWRNTNRHLGLEAFGAYHTDHLYFPVGIPTRKTPEKMEARLVDALDRFRDRHLEGWKPPRRVRVSHELPHLLMCQFVFSRQPEFYAYPLRGFEREGWRSLTRELSRR